jgi:hypothetical protein
MPNKFYTLLNDNFLLSLFIIAANKLAFTATGQLCLSARALLKNIA